MTVEHLRLTQYQWRAIQAALNFANVQVETDDADWGSAYFSRGAASGSSRPLRKTWRDLRRRLNLIHAYADRDPDVQRGVARRMRIGKSLGDIEAHLTPEGVHVSLRSPEECCLYAVWLFVKDGGALMKRLVRCEKCGAFTFNEGKWRTGPARREYCSNAHRKQLSVWKARNRPLAMIRCRPEGPWEPPWPRKKKKPKRTWLLGAPNPADYRTAQ